MMGLLEEYEIGLKKIETSFPLYKEIDAAIKYPKAYKDYQDYYLFWESGPQVFIFTDYRI